MGAGASANATAAHYRTTILDGKPLDASDVSSIDAAREEISRLRQLAVTALGDEKIEPKKELGNSKGKAKNEGRAAVLGTPFEKDYVKKTIPKSEEVKKHIHRAIKSNMLFRACSEDELVELIDAFELKEFNAGSTVIQQGDEGNHFYVVETGILEITVRMGEGESSNEVHVGVPYNPGSAFGELALMYGSPRAATIRAKEVCKLWAIDRRDFKGISSQYKLKRSVMHVEFLKKVKIGNTILGDVLKPSDIDAMALATQRDSFTKGDVIVREGEKGDAFYLIEKGTVDVFKKEVGADAVATLTQGQFFGEKALLSEDVRQATCIASSDVQCLFLMREDFVLMLGDLQQLLDNSAEKTKNDDTVRKTDKTDKTKESDITLSSDSSKVVQYKLDELEVIRTLGMGAFGRVKFVKVKNTPEGVTKTYALKCLSKRSIVENGLQDHVLNEKNIMKELDHPFILNFHCAMQDDKYIYFLLDVLLGGELFKCLRAETQFPEEWSRFYAASVLLAFCQIHARKIAYRDLKPENLVMDSNGYLKMVDFGLAKKVEGGKTWTLCGTPDYLAPEVILNEGHDWAVDYWALGVLIYEMTVGSPPFYADDPMEVYEKILSGNVSIPSHFSRGISDIVRKLLKTYQSKRLGRTRGGTSAVMKHKWFSGFDWDALLGKRMKVPIAPKIKDEEDASNFELYPEEDDYAHKKGCPEWFPVL